ncbi:MAG: NADP(H)-dependent aldo-keto reductase [Candidatus Dadabacteria bacterium]|nr:MAG: NADP(H)-dependent aldo-keto reductase [Candidatus Dadabacteria bacterium]
MQYRPLGRTGLEVSAICLGTMTWGEQNTRDDAFAQLDYAVDHGINFIDTAEMYPVPPRAETYTATETILGEWLSARGNRDSLIIASKVLGKADWMPWVRDGKARPDRRNIREAIEGSLRRLQTDYIDLYQIHWPDRTTNFFGKLEYTHDPDEVPVPIAETLETMTELVQEGKIRYVGVSNETPWGLSRYLCLSEKNGWARVQSIQNPYSLLNRSFEIGLAEFAHREDTGLLAYSPLGFGVLSGKYLDGRRPENARLTLFTRFTRYTNPRAEEATRRYVDLARQHGLDPAQMALAFVNSRPFVTANIIGATTMEQLERNIASIELQLPDSVLDGIEAIHRDIPNPAP